ncbi:MAG: cob(I)yrinic acid a,c-diamide adenosyltransferase [Sulfobacillus sp.]|nr:cob(I)yrinic acid a,c-diamide adenosyltransferase [Sulfobacillus sp.]
MKIYTKTGDLGQTSLWGHGGEKRVAKTTVRVEAYGAVDEANATIGMALTAVAADSEWARWLTAIQHRLFAVGADLSNISPDRANKITPDDVQELERWIDQIDIRLDPLQQFILPGGSRLAAHLHVARTVVRRAERRVVALLAEDPGAAIHVQYLNRLSDFLFVAAREANRQSGQPDVPAQF